ncbi:MAG: four helix bundle protein [Planctomycetota bacterium]
MGKITRFQEILAWQKARALVKEIYRYSSAGSFGKDFALRSQMRRAALSIMSNIAEGFARRTSKEFANFLNISAASAAEAQSLLYVAQDVGYMAEKEAETLRHLSEDISNMVRAFVRYLRTGHSKRSQ